MQPVSQRSMRIRVASISGCRLPRDQLLTSRIVCSFDVDAAKSAQPESATQLFPNGPSSRGRLFPPHLLVCTFQARLPDARWQQTQPNPTPPRSPATSPLLFNPNLRQHWISRTVSPDQFEKKNMGAEAGSPEVKPKVTGTPITIVVRAQNNSKFFLSLLMITPLTSEGFPFPPLP